MTKWDALLVNALAALCTDPIGHRDDQERVLGFALVAAPKATLSDPQLAKLATFASAFQAAWPERGSAHWARLKLEAGLEVSSALRDRCADLGRQLSAD
ncbi:MAG: hypothetical protein QM699_07605 [Amaricoccus sp.]|uniref:hypothetical protein n=1 Tax=Amaricoccus sp. TaxID=1872485 RepID=UPI0039E529BF